MNARNRLAALLAAGSLVMAAAAVTTAAPPTYGVAVVKSANPTSVPSSGGTVVYTVAVHATGTGFFGTVAVNDDMAGCTLGAPAGDSDLDGNLDPGETWSYTCTVVGAMPGDQNTASVNACHNGSGACNQTTHDATATSNTVTLGLGPDVTAPPATLPPTTPPDTAPPATLPPTTPPDTAPPATLPPTEAPATLPPATLPPTTPPDTAAPATVPPSTAPGTDAPAASATAEPTAGVGDQVDVTPPSSDTAIGGGTAQPTDRSWMLVLALGMLLASILVVNPARPVREDERQ